MIWIQIESKHGPVLFGAFYRPPNSDATTLEEMNVAIPSIPGNYPIVLCGDFNGPNINWSLITPTVSSPISSTFCTLVHDNFLTQLVSSPTREDHILDLVFTNNPSFLYIVKVVDNLPGCDHDAV